MSDERSTPRRDFIGQVAASAIVLAGAACAQPAAATSAPAPAAPPATNNNNASGPPPAAPTTWDDSWFSRLTAKHKAVFDSPEINEGLVIANATGYIRGMRDALGAGENEVQTVVVLRHAAVVMVFNDAMWEKYEIGKVRSVKGRGGEWATKNDYAGTPTARPAEGPDRPQTTLAWLSSRGHILLGCDLAARNVATVLARHTNAQSRAVYADLVANMVPGVILQPTGVYACHRAQEAGCTYIRST
jgi:hypothetical protein